MAIRSETITVKVEPELKEMLLEAATEDQRSLANLLYLIITKWVNERADVERVVKRKGRKFGTGR
jgi:predicted HicB family RNase H-like nuclease